MEKHSPNEHVPLARGISVFQNLLHRELSKTQRYHVSM
jgi:hypothetical protein